MRFKRAAGVLLHPTSLPGPYGVGDLGEAHAYIDWLADAGVVWWQVLPLNAPGDAASPYCARSTFAWDVVLVSPALMQQASLLEPADLAALAPLREDAVDYPRATALKLRLLRRAFERVRGGRVPAAAQAFDEFREAEAPWLHDWALFAALREAHDGRAWLDWPEPLALREPKALAGWAADHADEVLFQEFAQFVFRSQWAGLREHAAHRGVRILGDLPMFVALNSAEVWAHRELFRLDAHGRPTHVAGVPPDYFNADGQLWGNPLYDWERLAQHSYSWWIERVRRALLTVDALRLDHFRGFASFWEVPADAATARTGRWVQGPGRALFDAIRGALGDLPFVAEDLGDIDPTVLDLRDDLGLPGMAVLQFAFGPHDRSTFIPYRHTKHLAVYTGTHDNNTSRGWFEQDARDDERDYMRRYLGTDGHEIHWDMVRCAMASVADLAIVPHQDLAGLGSEGRMNRPGTVQGNWGFRLSRAMLDVGIRNRLSEIVWLFGRQPQQNP